MQHRVLVVCLLAAGCACRAQEANSSPEVAPAPPVATAAPLPGSVLHDLFSPTTLAQTLAASASDQIRHFPESWGDGVSHGFPKRAASEYGQVAMGNLIQSGVQRLHGEDPRYFRSGQGNFFARTLHVIANTLVVHSTSGGRTVSLALPAEAYGSWAIAARWYPPAMHGWGDLFRYGSANVAVKAGGNFFREFWPDVKGLFGRK